jgi:quercetin dioxygenase-like cupin family protein/DNA-binding XRE family transcriptional regulator
MPTEPPSPAPSAGSAPDGPQVAAALGQALRNRRKTLGLTLQETADLCGLSQPFLSQIENGKAMPSLLALHQVAYALGTTAQDLLQPVPSAEFSLVRYASNRWFDLSPGATVEFLVEGTNHQIATNLITAEQGAEAEVISHRGEEMIYMVEGSITVYVREGEEVELFEGDAFTYPAGVVHHWRNTGDKTAQFLFVNAPPSF